MKRHLQTKSFVLCCFATFAVIFSGCAASQSENVTIESPDGSKLLASDLLGEPKAHAMPTDCVKKDKASIQRGKMFFNELNNDSNVSSKYGLEYPKNKNFGNCVACHQIEKANGYGNIGPDLSKYHEVFVKTGARKPEWVYQKIADPRIDNKDTSMTVNLTTKLMTESEVCDVVSYIFADKK
jgi:L-cysteine S-thiosulfotransferase